AFAYNDPINIGSVNSATAALVPVSGSIGPNNPVGKGIMAANAVPSFLCPSNNFRPANGLDSLGYGYTDYGPTTYTDIDVASGGRHKGNGVADVDFGTTTPRPFGSRA